MQIPGKIITASLFLAGFLSLTACNTFEGMGKDMQTGGENLERSAERNK